MSRYGGGCRGPQHSHVSHRRCAEDRDHEPAVVQLGLPTERSRASAYRVIRTEVTRLVCETKQLPVLVIDEAHHLRNDVLEDLRLLCNYETDSENRLCVLLVGLTKLRGRLAMAVHESLSQRLVVRHHLTGLDRNELHAYLTRSRVRVRRSQSDSTNLPSAKRSMRVSGAYLWSSAASK